MPVKLVHMTHDCGNLSADKHASVLNNGFSTSVRLFDIRSDVRDRIRLSRNMCFSVNLHTSVKSAYRPTHRSLSLSQTQKHGYLFRSPSSKRLQLQLSFRRSVVYTVYLSVEIFFNLTSAVRLTSKGIMAFVAFTVAWRSATISTSEQVGDARSGIDP